MYSYIFIIFTFDNNLNVYAYFYINLLLSMEFYILNCNKYILNIYINLILKRIYLIFN